MPGQTIFSAAVFSRRSFRSLFLAALLTACGFLATAQNVVLIDSLRKAYITAPPEAKFALLNAIGFEYRYSYPDSTILYCTRAYDLGKSLHLKKDLSKPLSFKGLANANKGDFKESVQNHFEAIEVAIEQDDSVQLAFGYNNLGRMFFDEGDLPRASANLTRSRELFEILHNKSGLAYVFRSLANIYKSQHDYGQALEMSDRAHSLRKELGDPRGIVSALVELGLVYEAMNNGDKALEKFKMADSLAQRIQDKVTRAEVKLGMAEILFKHDKYEEANTIANDALDVVSAQTNQKLFLRANLLRANYYTKNKAYGKAIPVLEKIVAESDNNLSFKRDACFILAGIYGKLKNEAKETLYSNEYKILDEKLQNTNLTLQVNQLQFKLELERIEKENEVLKVKVSTQKNENILLLITVISVSAALFLVWLQSRRRRVIHQQLEVQNQQILRQGDEIAAKNRTLSNRNDELSRLNYEKDTLMNIVAHDLKSPINHILGITQIMEMDSGLNDQQKNYLRLMKEATHSGLDLIVDLLDVNALQEHKGSLNFSAFEWRTLVEDQLRSFETAAAGKHIQLISTVQGSATVISEPKYINRILDNLISNAIKFSEKGGRVEVETRLGDGTVRIAVRDSGPGFSDEDRKFLFQRFKKLSARPTGGESSNGLGLAIVKTLVDRLGGEIELKDNKPKGSEFVVMIPVRIVEKPVI